MKGFRVWTAMLGMAGALLFGACVGAAEKSDAPAATDGWMRQEDTEMETEKAAAGEAAYHLLTQEEAKARMDSGDALVILDVRTREEYDAGHIPGAVLLPNEEIGTEMPEALPDKDGEILVYCRSGNRSAQAAKKLVKMGYTAVYDFGGINSWAYDIVTDEGGKAA